MELFNHVLLACPQLGVLNLKRLAALEHAAHNLNKNGGEKRANGGKRWRTTTTAICCLNLCAAATNRSALLFNGIWHRDLEKVAHGLVSGSDSVLQQQ